MQLYANPVPVCVAIVSECPACRESELPAMFTPTLLATVQATVNGERQQVHVPVCERHPEERAELFCRVVTVEAFERRYKAWTRANDATG